MTVHNLKTGETFIFTGVSSILHAVCYAWAGENRRLSQFSKLSQDEKNTVDDFIDAGFPVVVGTISIACGDWAAL